MLSIARARRHSVRAKFGLAMGAMLFSALTQPAMAAESGKSVYLLGSSASMAGYLPTPGTYVSSINYVYRGDADVDVAAARAFPGRPGVSGMADIAIDSRAVLSLTTLMWVAPQKVLGGNAGLGLLVPAGYEEVGVDVSARLAITLPSGSVLAANRHAHLGDETTAFGDPLAMAFIGWHNGNWHTKLTTMLNIPVGSYDRSDLANLGFNRWAADLSGAVTWLDPVRGHEVSVTAGFTFNGENPATNYVTGTEFHVEAALMHNLSKSVALGVVAYHYSQITGDSGAGATFGDFKGETTAVGPGFNYNFELGRVPVSTTLRWYHEVETKHRLKGDAAYLTVAVPLGGSPR